MQDTRPRLVLTEKHACAMEHAKHKTAQCGIQRSESMADVQDRVLSRPKAIKKNLTKEKVKVTSGVGCRKTWRWLGMAGGEKPEPIRGSEISF